MSRVSSEEERMIAAFLRGENIDALEAAAREGHPMAGFLTGINPLRDEFGKVMSEEKHDAECLSLVAEKALCGHDEFDYTPAKEKFIEFFAVKWEYFGKDAMDKAFKFVEFPRTSVLGWLQFWLSADDSVDYFFGSGTRTRQPFLVGDLKPVNLTDFHVGEALLKCLERGWIKFERFNSDALAFLNLYAEMMAGQWASNANVSAAFGVLQRLGLIGDVRGLEDDELQLLVVIGVTYGCANELGRRLVPLAIPRLDNLARRDWLWGTLKRFDMTFEEAKTAWAKPETHPYVKWAISQAFDEEIAADGPFENPTRLFEEAGMPEYVDVLAYLTLAWE